MLNNAVTQGDISDREFILTDKDFREIVTLVHAHAGIALADHKCELVYSRLARRLRALGMHRFSDYLRLVKGDGGAAEIGNLINAITTNLTAFFREKHHFDHLASQVVAPLVRAAGARKELMIWSAGCSTGEEPYSAAMTIAHAWPNWSNNAVRILATDLDTNALAACRAAQYARDGVAKIPLPYQKEYLRPVDAETVAIAPELRSMIAFKQLNLQGRWPMKRQYDVIFCRNVMIYFDDVLKKSILNGFHDRLKPGGTLYIGHSESATKLHDGFELIGRTTYVRLP